MYDLVVIGAGPAGLTGGLFAVRNGLKTLVLDDPTSLSQVEETPQIDDYPGFIKISGMDLIKKFKESAIKTGTDLKEEKVLSLSKTKTGFEVKTEKTTYQSNAVILATGAKHRKALVPGEDEFGGKGVSYCATCDGPLFKGKEVLVIGGSDSAVIEALLLDKIGVKVTLVHRRDKLRAAKANQDRLFNTKIKIIWDTVLRKIKGDKFVTSATLQNVKTRKVSDVKVNGIFIAIGTVPTSELAKGIGVKLDERGFIIVDKNQKTNIAGVFAAGDCCNNPTKKIASAVGDGAVAAEAAYFYITGGPYKAITSE